MTMTQQGRERSAKSKKNSTGPIAATRPEPYRENSQWTRAQFAAVAAPAAEWGQPVRHMAPLSARYSGQLSRHGYRMGPGVDLQDAQLAHADLRWTNLRCANLKNADLQQVNLCGASLIKADLTGADLSNADLTGADLVGANLTDIRFTGASFMGARYSQASTRLPRRFGSPESLGMVAVDAYQDIG